MVAWLAAWCLGAGTVQTPATAAQSERLKVEYRRNFRSGNFDSRGLKVEGPAGRKDLVTADSGGIRIEVPPATDKPVGVRTRFRVRGDFEITAGFVVPPDLRTRPGSKVVIINIRPAGEWGNDAQMAGTSSRRAVPTLSVT